MTDDAKIDSAIVTECEGLVCALDPLSPFCAEGSIDETFLTIKELRALATVYRAAPLTELGSVVSETGGTCTLASLIAPNLEVYDDDDDADAWMGSFESYESRAPDACVSYADEKYSRCSQENATILKALLKTAKAASNSLKRKIPTPEQRQKRVDDSLAVIEKCDSQRDMLAKRRKKHYQDIDRAQSLQYDSD
jgi:hypothetical protein